MLNSMALVLGYISYTDTSNHSISTCNLLSPNVSDGEIDIIHSSSMPLFFYACRHHSSHLIGPLSAQTHL
jgi:hypothetical protein